MSVSPNGNHVISCGSDRVVRLVTKTDEPLILEDEAEEERAREEEKQLATDAETTVKGTLTQKCENTRQLKISLFHKIIKLAYLG